MTVWTHLRSDGYLRWTLSQREAETLEVLKSRSRTVFDLSSENKDALVQEGLRSGYRPIGGEYVGNPANWDVNESLSFSVMDSARGEEGTAWTEFYDVAIEYAGICDNIVQFALRSIANEYGNEVQVPRTWALSWLQVNCYRPRVADSFGRSLMQDRHEDGHLLTVWHSDQDGLEVFENDVTNSPLPKACEKNEVFLFPGDLLSKATGGDVRPLFHQVRRVSNVQDRLSFMYFSNPDVSREFFPFNRHAPKIDLAELTRTEKLAIRPGAPPKILA